ncbi:sensor histidine kinase [Nocardia sp. NPDC003482]|uniref:sensor histidine kinase n=1 Tax=Nocardia sp. NPDC004068 TaxID=3364303 RepID=UPI003675E077
MRERLRTIGRRLIGDDPAESPLARFVVCAALGVNLLYNHHGRVPVWLWAAVGVACAGVVTFSVLDRRHPRIAVGALAGGAFVAAAAAGPATDAAAFVTTCVAIGLLSQQLRVNGSIIVTVAAADGAVLAASATLAHRPADALITALVVLCAVTLLGLYRRQYRFRARATASLREQIARTRQERTRAAGFDERTKTAREMHEVLTNSLGALAVQLDLAEGLLSENSDLPGALARVRRSRRLAAESTAEARAVATVLRDDTPPLDGAVRGLVDEFRRDHHMTIDRQVTGTVRAVDPTAAVAVLGAAREALANASKHAPGAPVSVVLSFDTEWVRVSVHNPAARNRTPDSGSGYGLTGMKERVALVGGSLSAGPGHDGRGWSVLVEVPG